MYIVETFIYLGLILLFCHFTNLYEQLKHFSKAYQIVLILFLIFLISGQVFKSSHHTYPSTYWGMYSQVIPDQTYDEFLIHLDNGKTIHYPFELVTFTSQRAFMRKLRNTEQSTADDEQRKLLSRTAEALATIYEEAHPGQTVHSFTMNRVHIRLTRDEETYITSVIPLFTKEFPQ